MTAAKSKSTDYVPDSAADIEAYFERKAFRQAPAWMPEEGATIKAEVIGLKMGLSEYKSADHPTGEYPIIVYKVIGAFGKNGAITAEPAVGTTVSVHAFHTILRNELRDLGTAIGKVQWITYEGKQFSRTKKDKDGDPLGYHLYDVENDGETAIKGKDENFAF